MKKLITSAFMLFIALCSIAQSDTSYYFNKNKLPLTSRERVHAAVSMGAGVSFLNSGSSSTYTFIAPSIQYQLNQKFTLTGGLIHYNLTGPLTNRFPDDNNYPNNKTYSGNIIQVGGLYKINDRLTLSGNGLYQVNPYLNNSRMNYNSTSLGIDYKVNEHTSFSIRTNLIRGASGNSLYYNPGNDPYAMPSNGMIQRSFNTFPSTIFPNNF